MKFKKIRKCLAIGGLLSLLVQPISAYHEVRLEDVITMHPSLLMGIGFGIFSEENPFPIVFLMYDTNKDGFEDARYVYSANPYSVEMISVGSLINYYIDWNKNMQYGDNETYVIGVENDR